MRRIIFSIFLLICLIPVFSLAQNSPLDIRNVDIYDMIKNLSKYYYLYNEGEFRFQFEIDKNGKPFNTILPENIPDSIEISDRREFEKLRFTPLNSNRIITFTAYSTHSSPGNKRDEKLVDAYEKHVKRFLLSDGKTYSKYIEDEKYIEICPFHFRAIGCGSSSLSTVSENRNNNALKFKMPRKLTFPEH